MQKLIYSLLSLATFFLLDSYGLSAEKYLRNNYIFNQEEKDEIEILIQQLLNSSEWKERADAAELLGVAKDKRAIRPLISCLNDKEHLVREEIIKALGNMKATDAFDSLINILTDEYAKVREEAIIALVNIDRTRAYSEIVNLSNDESPSVRRTIGKMLCEIGNPDAINTLSTLLRDENEFVRESVVQGIEKIDDNRVVDLLITSLKDKYDYIRMESAITLGKYKDKRTIEPLTSLFSDNDWDIRIAAQKSLIQIGPLAVDDLIDIINIKSKLNKRIAACSLSALSSISDLKVTEYFTKNERVFVLLTQFFSDTDWVVNNAALNTFRNIGPLAIDALIDIINSKKSDNRRLAANTLSKIHSSEVETFLEKCLNNKDIDVVTGSSDYFIEQGDETSISILIYALKTSGSKELAETFMNCGNWVLKEAAQKWAKENNYMIIRSPKSKSAVWGSKKK